MARRAVEWPEVFDQLVYNRATELGFSVSSYIRFVVLQELVAAGHEDARDAARPSQTGRTKPSWGGAGAGALAPASHNEPPVNPMLRKAIIDFAKRQRQPDDPAYTLEFIAQRCGPTTSEVVRSVLEEALIWVEEDGTVPEPPRGH